MFVSQQPLPIMSNKVVIITGANSGIGYRTAEMLCQRGLEVILACRNETRGLNAVQKLRAELPTAKVSFMKVSMSFIQGEFLSLLGFFTNFRRLEPWLFRPYNLQVCPNIDWYG